MKFDTKIQNVFFTSDTHFNHANIIKYCNRPFASVEEMNQKIIDNWNAVVQPNDIVFHCGDIAFGKKTDKLSFLNRLNGKIYLAVGNHDYHDLKEYKESGRFEDIKQQYYIKVDGQRMFINHFPLLTYAGPYSNRDQVWQAFGHVHTTAQLQGPDADRLAFLLPTQYDVGVDNNNFTPISFKEFSKKIQNNSQNICVYPE